MVDRDAGSHKHLAVGTPQVDVGLARGGIAVHDAGHVKSCLCECLGNLVAHLEAVGADARTHRGMNLLGLGSQPAHGLDSALGDAPHRAAPARMGDGDDARHWVGQGDGHTVGGVHPDADVGQCGHQCIHLVEPAFLLVNVGIEIGLVNHCHMGGVGLSRHHQLVQVDAHLLAEHQPCIQHPQCVVAGVVAQIPLRVGIAVVHRPALHLHRLDARHLARPFQLLNCHHLHPFCVYWQR